ncbi:MAG: hypothetical protein RL754_363 [Bacteroidota bacterium]
MLPGIAIATTMALIAHFAAPYVPNVGSTLFALLFGALAGNTFMNGSTCAPGLKFVEKRVLEAAIVATGFSLHANHLQALGWEMGGILLVLVVSTMILAWIFGKLFKTTASFNFILGAGSAICGSSAIAATAPIVDASEEETGLALGIVNALGLIGLVALPTFAELFSLSDLQSGAWIGSVLQSLGHVVASGHTLGDEVGQWATVVKMGRILFMVPLLIALYFLKPGKKAAFPWFIVLFVAAVLINQWSGFPPVLSEGLSTAGKWLLNIAMAAIGAKIRLGVLLKISRRGIAQGALLFVAQIALALSAVMIFLS